MLEPKLIEIDKQLSDVLLSPRFNRVLILAVK